jgi:hypothetical protein
LGGADRQDAFILADQPFEGIGDPVESVGQQRRDAAAGVRQGNALPGTVKELQPEPLFQQLDLIAHRRLRHSQFGGGEREILVPRGGFENPDGGKRREVAHGRT